MTRSTIASGIAAGLAATIVLSPLMIVKAMIGLMPELNVIAMLTDFAGASSPVVGWTVHFLIGTVGWGVLFALIHPFLPGDAYWLKGIVFGIAAWLLMMVLVMPMAKAGLFGMKLGIGSPVMMIVMHIIYGAVLGSVFGLERPHRVQALRGPRMLDPS